jgi:hypothetical protein
MEWEGAILWQCAQPAAATATKMSSPPFLLMLQANPIGPYLLCRACLCASTGTRPLACQAWCHMAGPT